MRRLVSLVLTGFAMVAILGGCQAGDTSQVTD